MSTLHVIQQELLSRNLPEPLEQKTDYLKQTYKFQKTVSSMNALLLADAEQNNFSNNAAKTLDLGEEYLKRDRNTIMRLLRVGRLLLDVSEDAFDIMKFLSSDKNIELLTIKNELGEDEMLNFVKKHGHKLIDINKEDFQEKCYEFRGKELKPKKAKNDKEQMLLPGFDDAVNCITNLIDDEFDFGHVVKDAAVQDKAIKSGMHLLSAAIAYEYDKTIPNTEVLEKLKRNFLDTAKGIEQIIAQARPDKMLEK